ncbi:MAG: nitrate/sulfonate/bicarbonate family transporter, periplasmic ligand binding protein [Rhodospirillales bacterium]|nr:nitrate/sulfonate/bicarbonate family transporter, periplasmic ligand binding protein [Rhodospirillales bacterium]
MTRRTFRPALAALLLLACGAAPAVAQDKIKIGYWTSGFSVGFGAVLEAGKFVEQQGLQPEWVHFSDVNGPTKALLTQSIDLAFAAPTTGAFALGIQGAPVEIVLATQVAEATFVAKEGSPLHTLADLKGKKLGMSPAGSATYAIVATVLERNYGLKRSDYNAVPGNEGRLVQFLQQGDIAAASLRAVTLASIPDLKLQTLGSLIDEWKKMTKTDAVPILGATIVHKTYAKDHADGLVKFIRAMIAATAFGAAETDKASEILRSAANLDAKDATAYARLWKQIYIATMEPVDVATLKTMAEIFKTDGTLDGIPPDSLYVTAPYEAAKRAK